MDEGKDRKKRSVLRAATTKLIKKIEGELKKTDDLDLNFLEESISILNDKQSSLAQLDAKIEDQTDNMDQLEIEVTSSEEYKEDIIVCRLRVLKLLAMKNNSGVAETTAPEASNRNLSSSPNASSQNGSLVANARTVKLPRLVIEKFNGDATAWQNFWSQFSAAIHNNESLCEVDKFNYLKSYLTGSAATAITGLPLISGNYEKAIDILKSRFGRRDVVLSAHMNKLLSLSPVKRSHDLAGLRRLYDECEVQVRSLETLGVTSDSYGCLLCPLLIKMLPDDLILDYNRQRKEKDLVVTDLLTFVKNEIESRERTQVLSERGVNENRGRHVEYRIEPFRRNNEDNRHKPKPKWPMSSAATLNAVSEEGCVFCEKVTDHESDDCATFSIPEKKDLLKKRGRCFGCFKKRHVFKFCNARIQCSVCKKRHRKALCEQSQNKAVGNSSDEAIVSSVIPQTTKLENKKKSIYLQTVQALVLGPKKKIRIRCLLDGGSQRTFVRQELSRKLQLPVAEEEPLKLYTFGNENAINTKRRRVKIRLQSLVGKKEICQIEALETPEICSATIAVPCANLQRQADDYKVDLSDVSHESGEFNSEIDILIGSDFYWKLVSGKVKRLNPFLMFAETKFGWTVQGPVTNSDLVVGAQSVGVLKTIIETQEDEDNSVSKDLKSFWELESLGITNENTRRSISDKEAVEHFNANVSFVKNRYEVRLPWKDEVTQLPNNYLVAKKRFDRLIEMFKKDPMLHFEYQNILSDYLRQGIVEEVKCLDLESQAERSVYYLPHRPVVREDRSTTKVRIVFDASSHRPDAPSLNDLLHSGPNLNPDLLNLLMKFRYHQIAFLADIEKAFLQISLAPEDRDLVRFLWMKKLPENDDVEIKIMRMTRVLFGVTSSPFLLAIVLKHHIAKYADAYPDTCAMLESCMYVDDFIGGSESIENAYKISIEAQKILKEAGMSLRKWQSNSTDLRKMWGSTELEAREDLLPNSDRSAVVKILGLIWDVHGDYFRFDVTSIIEFVTLHRGTKRCIIQTSGRIFDPIGFLSPFTMRIKCIFQELWEHGIKWDDKLPVELLNKWDEWCRDLQELNRLVIPRHYFQNETPEFVQEVEIHCFTDASSSAYGAVAYIRYIDRTGKITVTFLCSKNRIAPIKRLSLPRLELMGALIGARMTNHIRSVFPSAPLYFWTDSTIALCWIRSSLRNWKQFVSNRVREIKTLTEPENWQHCPGSENPADMLTRGLKTANLVQNDLWWTGPCWLKQGKDCWPALSPDIILESPAQVEEIVSAVALSESKEEKESLFDLSKYSRLSRVLRITAWIMRFVNNSRKKSPIGSESLEASELEAAENYWVKKTQANAFPLEIASLVNNTKLSNDSRIRDLSPFLDSIGLLRVGGRLHFSDLTYSEKHPILLPNKHEFSALLIKYCHERVAHGGVASTLAEVRERMWILRARQLVKTVIGKCSLCKIFRAKPANEVMAPLPSDRIQMTPAFEAVGIDFAGPMYVRDKKNRNKVYIALFTCATTRAVHLELVSELSTETFLLAFKRFISRRGVCKVVYSDNAKTFKKADRELQKMWKKIKDPRVKDFFGAQGITWKFIVPLAPWWGGFWERLVRSVKTNLKKILGRALLNFEELSTVLIEVEAIINSRPLTYTYNDLQEPFPLTPSHFLVGKRLTALPKRNPQVHPTSLSAANEFRKRLRYQETMMNSFWNQWKKQYLLDLRSNHYGTSTVFSSEIKKGDIVLISENRMPRQSWKMGLVEETFSGRDSKTRSCAVRLPDRTVLKRPVQLLYPVEIRSEDAK